MDPVHAWCLVNGEWVEREDPVMAACEPDGGDVCAAMAGLGFEAWCRIGADESPATPVTLAVYSRESPPLQFLLQLEGNAGNVVEHIFAETLPDAMNLLATWSPIAQAGAVVELIRRFTAQQDGSPPAGPHRVPARPFAAPAAGPAVPDRPASASSPPASSPPASSPPASSPPASSPPAPPAPGAPAPGRPGRHPSASGPPAPAPSGTGAPARMPAVPADRVGS